MKKPNISLTRFSISILVLMGVLTAQLAQGQLSDDPNPATDIPFDPTAGGSIPNSSGGPFTISTVTPAPGCAGNTVGSQGVHQQTI